MASETQYETQITAENLMKLEKAIFDGVRTVKYSDKEITYRSLNDMLRLRDMMRKQLGLRNDCGKPGLFGGRRMKMRPTKGLCDASDGVDEHGEE